MQFKMKVADRSLTTVSLSKYNMATATWNYAGVPTDPQPFATVRNASGTNAYPTNNDVTMRGDGTTLFKLLGRGIIIFNTSSIAGNSVTSATLTINGSYGPPLKALHLGGFQVGITGGAVGNVDSIAASDYQGFADTVLSDDYVTPAATETYTMVFTLNLAGRSYINTSGYTVFFVRYKDDIDTLFSGVNVDNIDNFYAESATLSITYGQTVTGFYWKARAGP